MDEIEDWIDKLLDHDDAEMISLPAGEFKQILDYAYKIVKLFKKLRLLDWQLHHSPKGRKAGLLWEAWYETLWELDNSLQGVCENDSFPIYLMTLRNEFGNLMSGVPARLLRLDGAAGGVNQHSHQRISWQLQAAALLRLFMERDRKGSQIKAAEKIANALYAGGMKPPGRADKSYEPRTVKQWLRKAEREQTGEIACWYEEALSMMRLLSSPPNSPEKLLINLTAQIKSEIFLPNAIEAKRRAIRQKRARG